MTTEHTDVTIPVSRAKPVLLLAEDGTTLSVEYDGASVHALFAKLPTLPVGRKLLPLYAALSGNGEAEPVACWVVPGVDTARDSGFIDAMAWKEGEFTKPLYAYPAERDAEPVAWQWRNKLGVDGWGSAGWGYSDPGEMGAQYEKRPLYATPPAAAKPARQELIERLKKLWLSDSKGNVNLSDESAGRIADIALTPPAAAKDDTSQREGEVIERVAQLYYATFCSKPAWVAGGNSSMQELARGKARDLLADVFAHPAPVSPAEQVEKPSPIIPTR